MRPVEACHKDGILKPAHRLQLRQGEKVAVIVLRRPDSGRWDMKRLAAGVADDETLAATGLDAWADALDARTVVEARRDLVG
jgi:predicted DNA-binding antitoxin AbrB/MazE fold protein